MIIAEAAFQTNDKATATTALNNVRARYSKAPIANPTLTDIMNEKYIITFQNVEAWSDYKRTLHPGAQAGAQQARGAGTVPLGHDGNADEHQRPGHRTVARHRSQLERPERLPVSRSAQEPS